MCSIQMTLNCNSEIIYKSTNITITKECVFSILVGCVQLEIPIFNRCLSQSNRQTHVNLLLFPNAESFFLLACLSISFGATGGSSYSSQSWLRGLALIRLSGFAVFYVESSY